jgi:hypothetical protein
MAITIGDTTITGLTTGGLPDGIIGTASLATPISNVKLGSGVVINDAYGLYDGNGTSINTTSETDILTFTYTPISSNSVVAFWYHFNTWYGSTSGNGGDLYMKFYVTGGSYATRTQIYSNPRVIGNFSGTGMRYLHSHFSAITQFTNSDTSTKTITLAAYLSVTQPSAIYIGSDSGGTRSYYIEERQA